MGAGHSGFADVIDAPEQLVVFRDFRNRGAVGAFRITKDDVRRIYHFGVHRSFNPAAPWFAEIVITWSCD
jgi:hypothetical protein